MQSARRRLGRVRRRQRPRLVRKLPFCDFGEVIDPPSADVTAHAVELLAPRTRPDATRERRGGARAGCSPSRRRTDRGSAAGVSTTSTAPGRLLCALAAAGVPSDDPRVRRAVAWLKAHQNADGGWGEDCRSYVGPGVDRARREHRLADGVGAARAARGRRGRAAAAAPRRSTGCAHAAAGRQLGRAAVHRHRLPRRLLHQLPPLPAGVPGDGAGPCLKAASGEVPGQRSPRAERRP